MLAEKVEVRWEVAKDEAMKEVVKSGTPSRRRSSGTPSTSKWTASTRRLRELGAVVSDHAWPTVALNRQDVQLIAAAGAQDSGRVGYTPSRPLPRLDTDRPVPVGYLLPFVHGTSLTPAEVARRLVELGFELPPEIELVLEAD